MRNGNMKDGSLDGLIVALCRDFSRRKAEIESGFAGRRTLIELRYLNIKLLGAAAEIAGDRHAEVFVQEIGEAVGYAKSQLIDKMSETSYKRYKALIKNNIAKKLHLSD